MGILDWIKQRRENNPNGSARRVNRYSNQANRAANRYWNRNYDTRINKKDEKAVKASNEEYLDKYVNKYHQIPTTNIEGIRTFTDDHIRPMTKYNQIPTTNIEGIRTFNPYDYASAINTPKQNKTISKSAAQEPAETVENAAPNNENKTAPDDEEQEKDNSYRNEILKNSALSSLQNSALLGSIHSFLEQKRNTPNASEFRYARDIAAQRTPVQRAQTEHISGDYKFTPYDYMQAANAVNAQTALAMDNIGKQSRGNMNLLAAHSNNMLANSSRQIGDLALKGYQTNEAQRMAVQQANNRADEANANADNNTNANYANAVNQGAMSDKHNKIAAQQDYAKNKWIMDENYQNKLDKKYDDMIDNLTTFGENAYNRNVTNSNLTHNYWTKGNGVQAMIKGQRYVDNSANQADNYVDDISEDDYNNFYNKATDDQKAQLKKLQDAYGKSRGRMYWYKTNNLPTV